MGRWERRGRRSQVSTTLVIAPRLLIDRLAPLSADAIPRDIKPKRSRKSRRALNPDTAREMVRVREARRAFRRFRVQCFWSFRPDLEIGSVDVRWVAEQLMRHGSREAWLAGRKLCP